MFVCLFVGLLIRFLVSCGIEMESFRSLLVLRSRLGFKEGEVILMSLELLGKEDYWE